MATEQTISLNITGITYFRNALYKTPAISGTGTSGRHAAQTDAAAKNSAGVAAQNDLKSKVYNKYPSLSSVQSGYGSSNSIEGSSIGERQKL